MALSEGSFDLLEQSSCCCFHIVVVVVVVVVSSFRIQGTQEPVSVPQFLGKGTDVKLHKSHK